MVEPWVFHGRSPEDMRGVNDDRTLTFGRYRFNPRRGLWRRREEVRLAPRALSLLRVLLERPGQVVTKDELFSSVWSGTIVSDAALATCVQDLRHALRDDARQPRYVQTLHRRGYRFLPAPSPSDASALRPSRGRGSEAFVTPRAPWPIGRTSELEVLRNTLARARAGERQIVLVTGEAGIGKSALVDAFV